MTTVYVDPSLGDDTRTYLQAQSASTPWKTTDKPTASATANDTVSLANGAYNATTVGSVYAQGYHSFAKLLVLDAANDGAAVFTGTDANYVARISSSLPAGTLSFDGIVFNAQSTATKCFEVGDMTTKVWTVSWSDCTFSNGTAKLLDLLIVKGGNFATTDCVFAGSPTGAGFAGITGGTALGASNNWSVTHTRPVFNLVGTQDTSGINQDCASAANTIAYTVDGASGEIGTTSTSTFAIGIQLRCPGARIVNTNGLRITAPDNNSSSLYGLKIYPNAVAISDFVMRGNRLSFIAPGGYGIAIGDSTTVGAAAITGGDLSGNYVTGKYYSLATPHGIAIGRSVSGVKYAGNTATDFYCNHLASRTTSGTASGNVSRDCYGVDYYAKGCTAFTFTGNTAIQTGKYARRNLAPFSIDSQGGTTTTATTMSYNTFICTETDFTRVGALANITTNNNGTFTGNTYIVPDTWDTDTTDRFFVGGAEGGRSGATGYTIDEWISGTAGSVSATNGTGTISVSGETVIRLPIAQIRQLLVNFSVGTHTRSRQIAFY